MKPEGEDIEWRPSVFWIIAEHAFQIVWEQSSTSLHTYRRSQESALIQAITVQREDAKICPDQSGVDLLGFGDEINNVILCSWQESSRWYLSTPKREQTFCFKGTMRHFSAYQKYQFVWLFLYLSGVSLFSFPGHQIPEFCQDHQSNRSIRRIIWSDQVPRTLEVPFEWWVANRTFARVTGWFRFNVKLRVNNLFSNITNLPTMRQRVSPYDQSLALRTDVIRSVVCSLLSCQVCFPMLHQLVIGKKLHYIHTALNPGLLNQWRPVTPAHQAISLEVRLLAPVDRTYCRTGQPSVLADFLGTCPLGSPQVAVGIWQLWLRMCWCIMLVFTFVGYFLSLQPTFGHNIVGLAIYLWISKIQNWRSKKLFDWTQSPNIF